jgi:hypothetical protein
MEFVCPDPEATVRAANVRATFDAFKLVQPLGLTLMRRHDLVLDDLAPDRFVLVQRWLDMLREIQTRVGISTLRAVGAAIIENAEFPPAFASVEAVLLALDAIYYVNHKGDVGHYRTAREPNGVVVIRCETPYPRAFERGLVEGICRSKLAGGKRYDVEYIEGPPDSDLTCTLRVRDKTQG